ncbi:LPXTG cell wall anchor domain-containing protein [Streptomonospora sp. PA3]|uniref:LPXTG cell wall anchor domain-containing protein n=1 Tax=Streptomonospora sp. PA3 TaxID=2607326 RepID=UPI0012DDD1A6|nr:LPXTG cell wall anchor domain-containing protein [Streptomonospora sp. PA3]MUL41868.1 LPXTG cell wall anchor domain-containing protein [Streptomonospora sp. PA3]
MSHGYWLKNTARLAGGALLIGSVSFALGGTAAADATTLDGNHKGNNGRIKVHDSSTTLELPRNEPHVCEFYLAGHKFDSAQAVSWKIKEIPPTGERNVVAEGELTLDEDGNGRTDDIVLPDGHYKAKWEFEGKPQLPGKKHKVFWVDCEEDEPTAPPEEEPSTPPGNGETTPPPDSGETTPPPDEEPSTPPEDGESTPPEDGEATPPADDKETPAPDEESAAPDDGGAAPPADDSAEGGLPVTGAALSGLVAAGVVAVGGGGAALYLTRRKKTAPAAGEE